METERIWYKERYYDLDELPNKCPFCHKDIPKLNLN